MVALAHRGGGALSENTLKAFADAVGLGYRYLETDVQVTRDGELLAFHDADLERVTGRAGAVGELLYAELADALVGGLEPIPRMAELLDAFPHARFNIDLKSAPCVDPLVDLLIRTGAQQRVCVGSFSESVLRAFRAQARRRSAMPVLTSCGILAAAGLAFAPFGARVPGLLHDTGSVLQVPHRYRGRMRVVDRGFVERAHAGGRHVHVWTINDRAEMEELLDLGVDGIITDRTEVLRDVLLQRGQWEGAA